MFRFRRVFLGFASFASGAAGCAAAAVPAPAHDMLVCAIVAQGYVVGSKLATDNGLFRRAADGSFRHFGINYPGIFSVAVDPRDSRVLYTAAINGCILTADGGRTWRIGTGWDITEPKEVRVDPFSPDRVFLALPDGIAVSPDRGRTWVRRENGLPERGKYTQVIGMDRFREGRVLAGCESGIYLSEDGAALWRRVLRTQATVDDIEQAPRDPGLWIAATERDGVQVSRDGGLTWSRAAGVPGAEALYNVAFDPIHPGRIAVSSWTYGILVTEDGGRTWTNRNAGLPDEHRVYRVGIDPDSGRLYAAVYDNALYLSDNFGRSWKHAGLDNSRICNIQFFPRQAR